MNHNIIIIIMGIAIILISLYFLMKEDSCSKPISDEILMHTYVNENSLENAINLSEDKLMGEIRDMNNEVQEIKEAIKEINRSLYLRSQEDRDDGIHDHKEKTFHYIMNYNKFVNKNRAVIELFHKNKSAEEIAQRLNKSVREVEMVVKLIR